MTSIDELFKKPLLPAGTLKRKLEVPDAQQVYKSTKLSSNGSPNGNRNAHVSDDLDEDDDDDLEAGPALPPDEDDAGDDEEGRFFGSGITRDAASAMNYIEEQEGSATDPGGASLQDDKIGIPWVRKLATAFSKKVTKNAELRSKHESSPAKFMDSEADLDAEIKSWSLLTENPSLYTEFVDTGAAVQLVGLLAHENTDIAIGALEILAELLDEDVAVEQEQWDSLVGALLEADLIELLLSNLSRLDEGSYTGTATHAEAEQLDHDSDRSGVYHILAILDALASHPPLAEQHLVTPRILTYLTTRMRQAERPCSQNKQFAAEILQVLLQTSPLIRQRYISTIPDSIDLFLQLLAPYRKRDPEPPKDTPEEEYVSNIFDALTCTLDEPEGKTAFLEAEGVELALIMLREGGRNISTRALRLLDHALSLSTNANKPSTSNSSSSPFPSHLIAERIITAAGLKPLFTHLLKLKSHHSAPIEHLLGILSSLLRLLPGESDSRIRLLAKFAEKDYAALQRLVDLRGGYAGKVARVEGEIARERDGLTGEEEEDAEDAADREQVWFLRRLDAGLFALRTVDVVLAWIVAEDGRGKSRARELLGNARGEGEEGGELAPIRKSLREMEGDLEEGVGAEEDDTREMLQTLIGCLET